MVTGRSRKPDEANLSLQDGLVDGHGRVAPANCGISRDAGPQPLTASGLIEAIVSTNPRAEVLVWGFMCDGEWHVVTEARVPLSSKALRRQRSKGERWRVWQANERLTRLRSSLGVALDAGAGRVHRQRLTDKWAERPWWHSVSDMR